jgi:DNA-binding transcriptional LysR family regulator
MAKLKRRGKLYHKQTIKVTLIRTGLVISSYEAMIACVASGTDIALVPRSMLETVRESDTLAVYSPTEEPVRVQTYLVWRQGEISAD